MVGWRVRDVALAVGVGLVALGGLVVQARGVRPSAAVVAGVVVVVAAGALVWRRRFPVGVGVAALVAVVAYGALLGRPGPVMLVFVVALYTVVDEGHLAVSVGLGAASVVAFAVADSANRTPQSVNGATLLHAGWVVAVIVGVTRNRRAYLAEARAREVEAERRAGESARRRAADERLRIAREVHDALGHHLSMINVQASAALHRPDPERSAQALAAIKQASGETLRELRRTVGILRHDDGAHAGLDGLDDLVTTAGGAGLDISTDVAAAPPLPPEVDRAAYRIVQEALTNVARHAGASAAVVRVRPDGAAVVIEIEDDGRAAPGPAGTGITGMTERAAALGGTLHAGPAPDGGFRVRARLPLPAAS